MVAVFPGVEPVQATVAVRLDEALAVGRVRRPRFAEVARHGHRSELRRALRAAIQTIHHDTNQWRPHH